MVASVLTVVYFTGVKNPGDYAGRSYMARAREPLKEKRFQNLLCAPSYKKEIRDLGNEGESPKTFPASHLVI